ncbi:hypothetical protein I8748_22915 [Nostoc sp. CENA67]|uniref:Uncharacterized protein n=1 Tax=Amazonocrinis nigriterrae CENA67 TaxID=2794033 RepID=A0A8J7HZ69_9NOST|nr:hypothetical protein [Amazonocrinis nigriterrae]MBH8564999.1 hypothetical protein [Amazonocrinis nigriterrae CENA67]
MSQAAISRGKEIIKQQIRLALRDEVVRIPVEDEANLAVFEQALRSFDIQRMLVQKNVSVEFYIPEPPIEQGKKWMLQFINNAPADVSQIIFPYHARDCADAQAALESPEVQALLQQRNITASIQRVDDQSDQPSIVIATYDQVTNGELDNFLRRYQQ